MSEWRRATLEELAHFQRGFDISKAEQQPGHVPVVSSSGITSYHSVAKVKGPGVTIGRKGTLGSVFYVPQDYWPHSTSLWVTDFKGNNPKFVYYFLHTLGLEQYDVGVSNPTLNRNHIHGLQIRIPDVPTQCRIAGILSAYDDLIENNRRRITILEETARLAYRKWFGEEEGTQSNTVGKVSDFFDITIGRTPPRKNEEYFATEETDLKWLSIKDMKANRVFALDSAEKLTKAGIEKTRIHISPPGTIFLSFKLTVGVVVMAGDSMATNEAIAHFETDDRALRDYTYCYLSAYQYDKLGSTSAIAQAINSDIVRKMDFVLPARPALDSFEKEVGPMFDQIENLSRQNAALAAARDMLLPRLMKEHIIMP